MFAKSNSSSKEVNSPRAFGKEETENDERIVFYGANNKSTVWLCLGLW